MVWTAIIKKKHTSDNDVSSVIFESSHDSVTAYNDFLTRDVGQFIKPSELIVLIPGRHTFIFFPNGVNRND